ncbi:MAG: zinc ribbon domain-containing protein [Candidatus Kapaibacterium sp.]
MEPYILKTEPRNIPHAETGGLAHCPRCSSVGYAGDKFCACCGAAMPLLCPHCRMVIRQRIALYCPHCGLGLEKKE